MMVIIKGLMMTAECLLNARQTQLHSVATQTLQRDNMQMTLGEKIVAGEVAHRLMVRADAVMAHVPVMAVYQYAGFAHLGRQLMNMRIINADQQRGFGHRLGHLSDEQ